jgi:hypothetical protein
VGVTGDCPSAAHGTNRDPYGCYERERAVEARIERAVATATAQPRRRLADLLVDEQHLDAGRQVAEEFVSQDRLDPSRPLLSTIVAGVIAEAEERGREEVRAAIRAMIEQREQLRDERRAVALRNVEGNLPHAAGELRWAADLDSQASALRVLLGQVTPS